MKYTQESLKTTSQYDLWKGEFEYEGILYTHAYKLKEGTGDPCSVKKVKHEGFRVEGYIMDGRPKFTPKHEILVFNYEGLGVLYVNGDENEEDW